MAWKGIPMPTLAIAASLFGLAALNGVAAENRGPSVKPILLPAADGRAGLAVAPDGRIAELVLQVSPASSGGRARLLYRERRRGSSQPTRWEVVASDLPGSAATFRQAIVTFDRKSVASVIFVESFIEKDIFGIARGGMRLRERVRGGSAWADRRAWPLFIDTAAFGPYLPWDPYQSQSSNFVFVRRGSEIDIVGHNGSEIYYRRLTDGPLFSAEDFWQNITFKTTPWTGQSVADEVLNHTKLVAFDVPFPVWWLGENPRNFSAAFDPGGRLHVLYSKDQFVRAVAGGTEQRSSLFYRVRGTNGSWTAPSRLNSPGNGFGDGGIGACLAVAPNGVVGIAASFVPRVRTGSTAGRAELRYFVRNGRGAWSYSVVASSSDGYVAGDGERGTGLEPWLVYDMRSRPRIVFTDHASEHMPSDWSYSGQTRLAYRDSAKSGRWSVRTIFTRGSTKATDFTTWRPAMIATVGGVAVSATSFVFHPSSRTYSSRYDFKSLASLPAP